MGGIFGTISKKSCVADLFYGTDYNSHLGTRRGGLATYSSEKGFVRSIHNLESSYFRTKFEPTLDKFEGATSGIGVISDTDAQPLIMNSHLGRFAICTVEKTMPGISYVSKPHCIVSGGSQTIRFARDPEYVYPTACEIELGCRIKKGAATFCRSTFAMLAV